ncbi:MAG TPA: carboxypeptidase-like regulatory domain-containing protein [Blastocatellia bacterium]
MNLKGWAPAFVTILAVVATVAPTTSAGGLGSIKGVVCDASGHPLVGAEVAVVTTEGLKTEKVIKRASTGNDGRFLAAGIVPGHYTLKAEASGFAATEMAAFVKPNKVTVFDSILLRRAATMDDQTNLNLDSNYASRAAQGVVFHYRDDAASPNPNSAGSVATAGSEPELLTPSAKPTQGFVYAFSQSVAGDGALSGNFPGVDFAVAEQLSRATNLTVSGQTGIGDLSPQRLEARVTTSASDRHQVAVAVGYGQFTIARAGVDSRLGQVGISATDTWQVSGPVVILYGLEMDRFAEGGSGSSVLPRFGIAMDAAPQTKLFADVIPGSTQDIQSAADLESGPVVFSDQRPVALGDAERPVPDRSFRTQVGTDHKFSQESSVQLMAFFDTISGHAVGLLALPFAAPESVGQFRAFDQYGTSRGMRIVYRRHLGKFLDASTGYSFGQGQCLSSRGIVSPASLFDTEFFQIVAARVDANFVKTGTKISTIMRVAPARAVFAIDPFEGEMTAYDPNLSVILTQALPAIGFLPGQWQAVIDLRNLLNQQAVVAQAGQEIIASQYHRLIRIGIAVRF